MSTVDAIYNEIVRLPEGDRLALYHRLWGHAVPELDSHELTSAPLSSEPRPYGLCAGEFTVPADFDAPLPNDVLEEFEKA